MDRRGEELVLATTNGAPAIVAAAACAPTVLLACLLNLDAVIVELLRREDPYGPDLLIVCSGTDGAWRLRTCTSPVVWPFACVDHGPMPRS